MISTKSNLFNNFALLIMFEIFYVHFHRPVAIFAMCYTSFVVSVTIFTQWHKMLKKKYYSASLEQILLDVYRDFLAFLGRGPGALSFGNFIGV